MIERGKQSLRAFLDQSLASLLDQRLAKRKRIIVTQEYFSLYMSEV